jgi:hypothetical protein
MLKTLRLLMGIGLLSAGGISLAQTEPINLPNIYCLDDVASPQCQLAQAMIRDDLDAVYALTEQFYVGLGDQLGVPDVPPEYAPLDPDAPLLTPQDIPPAYTPFARSIDQNAWWRDYPNPPDVPAMLRVPAYVVMGTLAAREAGADSPDALLALAREAADYLLYAQAQGGAGLFPTADLSRQEGRLAELSERFVQLTQERGLYESVTANGWFINDLGGGDLMFDNGLAGVAVLEFYEATGEEIYLTAGRAAADWALTQNPVPNWNYNAFTVFLLARAYRIAGETAYLDGAKRFARVGLYPGQLTEGDYAGRWGDPHNARLVYHYIIVRGLAELVAVLPPDDPDLPQTSAVLSRASAVRSQEVITSGVASPITLLEVLSRLMLLFPPGDDRLDDPDLARAWEITARVVTALAIEEGGSAAGAAPWGLYLLVVAGQD